MNAPIPNLTLPELGSPFEGGFYAGRILVRDQPRLLIVSPRVEGDLERTAWVAKRGQVDGARSFNDGATNTAALAAAGWKLAQAALEITINGVGGWYIPARDELEILYRVLKPTAAKNWCWRGDNPSSIPVGYPYTPDAPAQTSLTEFRSGGAQAFDDAIYWSSTQYAGDSANAWAQHFDDGDQGFYPKDFEFRCRLVRSLPL